MNFITRHRKLLITILVALVIDLLVAVYISPILSGLLLSLQTLVLYIWLSKRAVTEAFRPIDNLTGLRWIILTFITLNIFLLLPGIVYASSRLLGLSWEDLRGFVSVTSGLMKIMSPIMFVLIFEYKVADDK